MSTTPVTLPIDIDTPEMWEAIVASAKCKVVIEFYTPWCRESRMTAEIMVKMISEFPGILFCRYNMDKNYAHALGLMVLGVPTIILLVPIPMLLVPNAGPVLQPLVFDHI